MCLVLLGIVCVSVCLNTLFEYKYLYKFECSVDLFFLSHIGAASWQEVGSTSQLCLTCKAAQCIAKIFTCNIYLCQEAWKCLWTKKLNKILKAIVWELSIFRFLAKSFKYKNDKSWFYMGYVPHHFLAWSSNLLKSVGCFSFMLGNGNPLLAVAFGPIQTKSDNAAKMQVSYSSEWG